MIGPARDVAVASPGPPEPPSRDARLEGLGVAARGSLLRAAAVVIGGVLAIPASALLVRALGLEQFGALAFALNLVALLATLADLGVSTAVSRMSAFHQGSESVGWARTGARLTVISGSVAMCVCIGLGLAASGEARIALLVAAPTALVMTVRGAMAGLLVARRRVVAVEGSLAVYQLLYYGLAIIAVLLGLASVGLVAAAQLGAYIVALGLLVRPWRTAMTEPGSVRPVAVRSFLLFSTPLLLAGLSWLILQRSDVVMIGLLAGPRQVGLYAPILRIADLASMIVSVLGSYYVPIASSLAAEGLLGDLRDVYTTLAKWAVVLVGPMLAALAACPTAILTALFGPSFENAGAIARVLVIGYLINAMLGNNALTLTALGRSRQIGIRSLVVIGVNLAVNALLIPRFGALGAAIGTTVAYAAFNAANSWFIYRHAGIHPIRRDYVVVVTAGTAAFASSAFCVGVAGLSQRLAGAVVVGLVTAGALVVSWAVTTTAVERGLLRGLVSSFRTRLAI